MSGDPEAPASVLTCSSDPACVARMALLGVGFIVLGAVSLALIWSDLRNFDRVFYGAAMSLVFSGPVLLSGATMLFNAERARRQTLVFDAAGITVIAVDGSEQQVPWSDLAPHRRPALVHWGSLPDRKGWPRVRLSSCLHELPAALVQVADHMDWGPDGPRPVRFGSLGSEFSSLPYAGAAIVVGLTGAWHGWGLWLYVAAAFLFGDLDTLSVRMDAAGLRTSRWFRVRRLSWDEVLACEVVVRRRWFRREPELLLTTAHGPLCLRPSAMHLLAALATVRRELAART